MSENKLGTCWAGGSRHSGWHAKRPSCVEWRPMIESNPIAVILDEAPVESAPAPEAEGQAEAAMPDKTETVRDLWAQYSQNLFDGDACIGNVMRERDFIAAIDEALAQQKAEVERLQQAIRYECEQKIAAIEELHRSTAREEDTRYELATAESRLAEVMGVLREHEWNPPSWMCRREKCCGQCPICLSHNEHKPACWLAALLKEQTK